MPYVIPMAGLRFGRLSVLGMGEKSRGGKNRWRCLCDCGETTLVHGSDLRSGHTSSCGCVHREQMAKMLTVHGETRSPEYRSWCNMKDRCTNPKNPKYHRYGARGITVCTRWAGDFAAFLEDMGRKPHPGHSIERKDNNGNYDPGNCVWASAREQSRNTSRTRYVRINGRVGKLAELADELGVKQNTLKQRARRGTGGVSYV